MKIDLKQKILSTLAVLLFAILFVYSIQDYNIVDEDASTISTGPFKNSEQLNVTDPVSVARHYHNAFFNKNWVSLYDLTHPDQKPSNKDKFVSEMIGGGIENDVNSLMNEILNKYYLRYTFAQYGDEENVVVEFEIKGPDISKVTNNVNSALENSDDDVTASSVIKTIDFDQIENMIYRSNLKLKLVDGSWYVIGNKNVKFYPVK